MEQMEVRDGSYAHPCYRSGQMFLCIATNVGPGARGLFRKTQNKTFIEIAAKLVPTETWLGCKFTRAIS